MAEYKLNTTLDTNKVFLVKRSELEDRWDAIYYLNKIVFLNSFKYPLKKIKQFFIVKDGDHDKLPDYEISDKINGKRYLRAQDIKKGKILNNKPIYITKEYFGKIQRCHIYPNDLLISIMASLGLNAIVPEDFDVCTANRAVGILRNKTDNHLLTQYLQILIDTNVGFQLFEIEKKGGIQQRLNLSDLGNVKIPIPPKEIQQQIVDIYNTAYTEKQTKEAEAKTLLASIDTYLLSELGITLPEKNNSLQARIFTTKFSEVSGGRFDAMSNKSKELEDALLNGKFSTVKLSKLIKGIKTGTTPHNSLNPYVDNGIPFLRNSNLQKGELDLSDIKYIKDELSNQLTYSKKDEIIVCIAGTVGESVVNSNKKPLAINQNVTALEINNTLINLYFLNYFLNTKLNIELTKRLCSIATILYLNNSNLLSLNIPLPPKEKQDEIAIHIQNIRSQAKALQEEADLVLEQAKKKVEQIILR